MALAALAATLGSIACGGSGRSEPENARTENAASQDAPTSTAGPSASPDRVGDADHDDPVADLDAIDIRHRGAAWQLRLTSTGHVVAEHQPRMLDVPGLPGSVAKVVTALAALDQGRAALRVVCPRRLTVDGRRLDCVHPPRPEPFTLVDALAASCNTYFTRLAATLDGAAWRRLAARLGMPAVGAQVHPALLGIGLAGPTAPPTTWRRVLLRAVTDPDIPLAHRRLVRQGLRRAVRDGTAGVLASAWHDTLAKTGTTLEANGPQGLVVAWRPEEDLDLVVRVGGSGRDAAAVAAAVLDREAPTVRRVRVARRDAAAIEVLPLEHYVVRVVTAEAERDTPPAALRALAIASRTFAVAARGRHPEDAADVCDSTHCQVVAPRPTAAALAAADATRDVVLSDEGRAVPVYYSAACDGVLAEARQTWGGAGRTWSRVGAEPFPHPVHTWHAELPAAGLADALRHEGFRGDALRDVVVSAATEDGRPSIVRIDGLTPAQITADRFRTIVGRHLGWQVMKSHTWQLTRTSRGYRVDGRGKGHGVGLCLAGATTAASRGLDTPAILAAYFPDLSPLSLADEVTLRVSAASQTRAPALLRDVQAHLVDLRGRLATAAPRQIEMVEHPTIEAYQRATGRAWWTGGSTRHRGGTQYRVDLPPLARLEAAGRIDSRLRHELTHVLTEAALRDAPLWVHEGLARLLAEKPAPSDAALRGANQPASQADVDLSDCPSDDAIARAGSAERLQAAYAAASQCVARALEAGRGWRGVGESQKEEGERTKGGGKAEGTRAKQKD